MEPLDLPSHQEVADEAAHLRLATEASELHGSLCGLLASGAAPAREGWWSTLELDPAPAPGRDGALDRMYLATCAQLADPEMGFSLLLPDEEQPLEQRAEGLLGWCRGFLGGFGLGAASREQLSDEGSEALDDLAKIASSRLSYDDPESDEVALVEIAEFVRVAALLLHGDCHAARRSPRSLH